MMLIRILRNVDYYYTNTTWTATWFANEDEALTNIISYWIIIIIISSDFVTTLSYNANYCQLFKQNNFINLLNYYQVSQEPRYTSVVLPVVSVRFTARRESLKWVVNPLLPRSAQRESTWLDAAVVTSRAVPFVWKPATSLGLLKVGINTIRIWIGQNLFNNVTLIYWNHYMWSLLFTS